MASYLFIVHGVRLVGEKDHEGRMEKYEGQSVGEISLPGP